MKKQRTTREYDLENGVMKMVKNGKEYSFSFNGLPSNVFMKLAMIGAGSILCKVERPMLIWEKICQNRFGRERTYSRIPKVIHAYSRVNELPIEEAIKQYRKLTKKQKQDVRKDKAIQKALLQMKIEELE